MINVGIIGAGIWGGQHARVFHALPQTRLVAVCDLDAERAAAFGREQGVADVYTDHRELLARADIDAIGIATPDFTHTPLILDALAAGKHVLTEKPLATDVAESRRVVQAAAASGKVLMVDFHNRVNPTIAAARRDVAEGRIGAVIHGGGRLSNTTFVPLKMLSWAAKSSALWFLGSHLVDALRFILDDEVTEVFARRRDGVLRGRGVDTADVHVAILTFSRGAVITIENSWVLSPDNPQVFDFRVELVGEAGQIDLNPSHSGTYRRLAGSGLAYEDMLGITPAGPGRIGGFVQESIGRFVDAVEGKAPPLASAEDGLRVTEVLAAIEDSARTGLSIQLNA
ncbi:MAG: Gfo/Idh/MocA family oxidoreductase [Rhodobacteraceae bacterium]|nr:Gfo/Idh/MocA family oxidoreductase [Paracoccaceae bacterium]